MRILRVLGKEYLHKRVASVYSALPHPGAVRRECCWERAIKTINGESMKKLLIAVALGLSSAMPQAEAALFNFSFEFASGVFSGTAEGVLQPDGNTVIVSGFQDYVSFNGTPGPAVTYVAGEYDPFFTLDGSSAGFVACDDPACGMDPVGREYFFFTDQGATFPLFWSTSTYGGQDGAEPISWSVTSADTVPVPATLPLLGIGSAAMAFRRRKVAL